MIGPITRERFICTDASATAPGRSSRGTSVGRIAFSPGAPSAFAMPIANTDADDQHLRRIARQRDAREPEREHELRELGADEEPAAVDDVGEQPAERREEQQRPELREEHEADEGRRAGELQRVGAEHDVLHPRADVGREHAEVDDAEVAMPERGLRGAALERDVAVYERVLELLARELVELRLLVLQHGGHPTEGRFGLEARLSAEVRDGADHVLGRAGARARRRSTPSSSRSTSSVC